MPDDTANGQTSDGILESVKVELGVLIGKAHPTMGALSKLDIDEVLALDTSIDDPVQLFVGNRLIAEGMLEELTDASGSGIGVRVTRVIQQQKS